MRSLNLGSRKLPAILLAVFVLVFVALGLAPRYREDWLLENLLVAVAVPLLTWSYRRIRFSNAAYLAIFCFLVLHEIGSHYTYSEVPYDQWTRALFGFSLDQALGFERNHYDRLIHFVYGLLITPAIVELFAARAPPQGIWRWIFPVGFVMSHSVIYEMIEWSAALLFGGDLGVAYLGTQGDPWDAQQDMLLATLGSMLAVAVCQRGRLPDRSSQSAVPACAMPAPTQGVQDHG